MKNYGFIPHVQRPEDYIFGGITKVPTGEAEVLQPNGQWDEFLPPVELQKKNNVETMSCTTFATLNCLETIFKRKYNITVNFSERYTAITSGTTEQGNSPVKVIDTIRKNSGTIEEKQLPFDSSITTFDEFFSPIPMIKTFIILGMRWLTQWAILYEQVTPAKKDMKEALIYSPLGVSVFAWRRNSKVYIAPKNMQHNHWAMVYGYVEGKYWKCYDTYDHTYKKLDWEYPFNLAIRYHLQKRPPKEPWPIDLWKTLFDFAKRLVIIKL